MNDRLVDGDLTLRRAVPGDADDIAAVYSEPDTRHWMLWERVFPGTEPDHAIEDGDTFEVEIVDYH